MNKQMFVLSALLLSVLTMGAGFSFSGTAFAKGLPDAPYQVKTGDTLYSIAMNTSFPLSDLLKINGFTANTVIFPGEEVSLPLVYKVESGDELGFLANRYDTTVSAIKSLNHLTSDVIFPGMDLLIARGSRSIKKWGSSVVPVKNHITQNRSKTSFSNKAVVKSPTAQLSIHAVATAYDSSASENGKWGAVDYFGNPLKFGDIAVDPSVIPLGSKVFISGYSDPNLPKGGFYATAVDTGGAIKGDRIDIYLQSYAMAIDFGIENVKVTVFKK